ncbi:MAG: FliM/FliN family flagellar motor switch protein [Candidatus Saganbacteria bacterium]|nr:FliM/FliN family flagellar motor switch protein [Candidatus Saganbacteria bacterium]
MVLERKTTKSEIASQKRVIKLAPAIGDWTTYKPPKVLIKKVKSGLYGFDRLSKEELNQALLIHYRFVEDLLKRFKIDLAMAVELFSVSVEQTTYLNFLRGLSGPLVQGKIAIPLVHDPASTFLDMSLTNSIINYALGSRDLDAINRSLTEAEKITLTTAIASYMPLLGRVFENTIQTPVFSIVSSPDATMDQTINPSSTFVIFCAEVSLADNPPAKLYIGYCGNTLRTLLEQANQKEQSRDLNFSILPQSLLSKIVAPICATLGETELSTNDIQQLEIGDVVSLETQIAEAIPVTLGNTLKLLSQPGIKNKKNTIRIMGLKDPSVVCVPPPQLAEIKTEPDETEESKEVLGIAQKAPPPKPNIIPKKEKSVLDDFDEEKFEEDFPEDDLLVEEEFKEEEFPEEGI